MTSPRMVQAPPYRASTIAVVVALFTTIAAVVVCDRGNRLQHSRENVPAVSDPDSLTPRPSDGAALRPEKPDTSQAPAPEEPIDVLMRPLQVFAHNRVAGAVVLMAATVLALVWANSPWLTSTSRCW